MKFEFKGPKFNNNGKINLSVRQAAKRLGVTKNTAVKAFHDLQAKGFIVVTEVGHLGVAGHGQGTAGHGRAWHAMADHGLAYG